MIPFDFIELFAGVGGFRSALEKLGGRCVMASEINEHAQKSYRALYDETDELRGDITQIEAETVPDHHILVGGFPCQTFSIAGKKKGFEDTRGTMFFEVARIAAVKRPKLMFLENVPGLLSHDKGRTIKRICQILNEIGYAFDFNILNSKFYDVPQNRERVFIIASLIAEHEDWFIPKEAADLLYSTKRDLITTHKYRTFNFEWPTDNAVKKRLRDILEHVVDEKYYLSDEKTRKLLDKISKKDQQTEAGVVCLNPKAKDGSQTYQQDRIYSVDGVMATLSAQLSGRFNILEESRSDIRRIGNLYDDDTNAQAGRVYDPDGIAPTLLSSIAKDINIIEAQQFSDGSGIAHAIDANYQKGTSPGDVGKGRRTHVIEEITSRRYRIRRLTPLECWRLQGFTDEQFFKAKEAGVSDAQLYRQAGNAVSVRVINAIGTNLIKIIDHVPFRRSVKQVKLFG